MPTLRYTHRLGPIYTGHACRHLPSAVPWISEDRLLSLSRLYVNRSDVRMASGALKRATEDATGPRWLS